MSSEQPEQYVAAYGHEVPVVADLAGILDRYDQHRAVIEGEKSTETVTREEREQFALDYASFRESGLRAALEEVGWQLERRGHHAWIEDVGSAQAVPLVDGEPAPEVPRPLVFRVIPAHADVERAAAPQLSFVPFADDCRVRAEATYGDPRSLEAVPISVLMTLDRLTERVIVDLASDFVREVLLGDLQLDRVSARTEQEADASDRAFEGSLPQAEPDVESAEAVSDRGWADSSLTRRWEAQQRRQAADADARAESDHAGG